MNLDELRSVQSKERRKDSLQQLRDSFYEDVAAYITDLQATRDRRAEQVDNPFSDTEVRRLSDELETAEEVAEAVYERRVGKVVKLASFAAAEMSVGQEGMTHEEQALFDDLVERIKANKQTVLDVLAGGTPDGSTSTQPAALSETASTAVAEETAHDHEAVEPAIAAPSDETDSVLASAMGGDTSADIGSGDATQHGDEPDQPVESATESTPSIPTTDGGSTANPANHTPVEPASGPTDSTVSNNVGKTSATEPDAADSDTTEPTATEAHATPIDDERTTVRITKDVGDIFGVDEREYTLRCEDVVTLPSANAKPLLAQNAARRLD